jgi:SAM-dependent methyltransferase
LHVFGFDADEGAVELTRQRIDSASNSVAAAGGEARVALLKMEEAHRLGAIYDVALCLGNALPGLSIPGQLLAAMRGVAGALRPGGVFLTQNLNYDLRWREKAPWFPLLSGETSQEEVLLVKFADYEPEFINFHAVFLTRERPAGKWQAHIRSSQQLPLFRARLAELLTQAGFGDFRFWGDFAKSPFDPEKSSDLLLSATKL